MKIPMPKTSSWLTTHGSWCNFKKAIHKSIGRNLGGGTISYGNNQKRNLNTTARILGTFP
jgi:hypothetical protein